MGKTFDQEDVFPIIARLVEVRHAESGKWVTARELAHLLAKDSEGCRVLETAQRLQATGRSLDEVATNMVAWFSQRITVGGSEWEARFERERVDGVWAYKPVDNHPTKA